MVQGAEHPAWCEFDLTIRCDNALSYAASETSQNVTTATDPITFNVPASGVVAGSADAYPVWTITSTNHPSYSGTSGAITLTNNTTGEAIALSTMDEGDIYRLNAQTKLVEKSTDGAGATYSNAFDEVGASVEIPRLAHGVQNSITLDNLDNQYGVVTIAYRARYL